MDFTNKAIARLLRQVAATYLLTNENKFKIIAYERAADTIDRLNRELKDIWENKQLQTLSGIGPSILAHLEEYFRKPSKSYLTQIIARVPAPVFVLMDVPGLGPKKAFKLTKALKLTDPKTAIEDVRRACLVNKVATIETFGEKSQKEIVNAITRHKKTSRQKTRMALPYAADLADDIVSYLKKHPLVQTAEPLGSLRRMTATIGDIDIAVKIINHRPASSAGGSKILNHKKIVDYFVHYPKAISVINAGDKKASIIATGNQQIDLRVISEDEYGSMAQYFTGSKEHNIKLREYGLRMGYSLSEYGIKSLKSHPAKGGTKVKKFKEEKSFYQFLGLEYIPPELREGTNEIELAKKQQLPHLIELKDIKGDFHLHSSYDLEPSHDLGENTYEEIIAKARELRYEYVAFSDHNPSISRHKEKETVNILKRRKEYLVQKIMSKKNERLHFFISLEVDILPDGKIALPESALPFVDMVIVSVHSSFQMSKSEMTDRILRGLSYPKVKILGHPTTRLLGRREEIEADWETIFQTCKKKNIALEINAWPKRLDLPDGLVRQAVNLGVPLVINTDAHKNKEMEVMKYGVAVARRGWAKKTDILNTGDYYKIKAWIERK